jgi:hypothetical protein
VPAARAVSAAAVAAHLQGTPARVDLEAAEDPAMAAAPAAAPAS